MLNDVLYDLGYWFASMGPVLSAMAAGLVAGVLYVKTNFRPTKVDRQHAARIQELKLYADQQRDIAWWLDLSANGTEAEKVLAPQMLDFLGYQPPAPPEPVSREDALRNFAEDVLTQDTGVTDVHADMLRMRNALVRGAVSPTTLIKGGQVRLNSGEVLRVRTWFDAKWGEIRFTLTHDQSAITVAGIFDPEFARQFPLTAAQVLRDSHASDWLAPPRWQIEKSPGRVSATLVSGGVIRTTTPEEIRTQMQQVALAIRNRPSIVADIVHDHPVTGRYIQLNCGQVVLYQDTGWPPYPFTLYHKGTGLAIAIDMREGQG
jgi:hypothetical protein